MDINNLNKFIISRTEKIDTYLNKVDDNINLLKVLNKALSSKSKSKISKINDFIGGSSQVSENFPTDLEDKAKSISESKIQNSVTALVASIRSHHEAVKTTKSEFDKLKTALQKYKEELSAKAATSNPADIDKYNKLVNDTTTALERVNDAINVLSREESKTAINATDIAKSLTLTTLVPDAKGTTVPDSKATTPAPKSTTTAPEAKATTPAP